MQVTDAVKVGGQAIKENHVTLAEVQTCLDEVDEAISQQRETQTALGTASSSFFSFLRLHVCTDLYLTVRCLSPWYMVLFGW